jgi:phosphatidylglycerophosphatase A
MVADAPTRIPLIPLGLATWFGAGLIPKAPGTWGSLAALPFAWLILHFGGLWWLAGGIGLVFLVGWWASEIYVTGTGQADPGAIVIDEVAGQWIALLPAATSIWWHWLVGFVLFRFFDIVKPWPIGWADRRVRGGFGVMIDDVIAGIYAGVLLYALMLMGDSKNLF